MRSAIPLFLESDTVDHIDWVAKQLAKRRGDVKVSRSDVVTILVRRHWKKMMRQKALQKPLAKSKPLVLR